MCYILSANRPTCRSYTKTRKINKSQLTERTGSTCWPVNYFLSIFIKINVIINKNQ